MTLIDLLLAQTSAHVAHAAAPAADPTLWELTLKGGWLMIPLALLAIVSLYIFIERCIVIGSKSREDKNFMEQIKALIHAGKIEDATALCQQTDTPYSHMIEKGVSRIGRPMNDVLVAIENVGNQEVAKLERGFSWLSTTAGGAPMIGFLGTVTGMVQAFMALSKAGSAANITILSQGIYEALVTTVAGLIVGILALFAYNYLNSRVSKVMGKLERNAMDFMDLLNEPSK